MAVASLFMTILSIAALAFVGTGYTSDECSNLFTSDQNNLALAAAIILTFLFGAITIIYYYSVRGLAGMLPTTIGGGAVQSDKLEDSILFIIVVVLVALSASLLSYIEKLINDPVCGQKFNKVWNDFAISAAAIVLGFSSLTMLFYGYRMVFYIYEAAKNIREQKT